MKYYCVANVPMTIYTVNSGRTSTQHINPCNVWDGEERIYTHAMHARMKDNYKGSKSKYPRCIVATGRDFLYVSAKIRAVLCAAPLIHSINILNNDTWFYRTARSIRRCGSARCPIHGTPRYF